MARKKSTWSWKKYLSRISPMVATAVVLAVALLLVGPLASQTIVPSPTRSSLLGGFPSAALLPVVGEGAVPQISARNVFIWDQDSKVVLFQKSADQPVFPASTTKMMTALVVLEHFGLGQEVTVIREYPIGQFIGFVPGEKLTIEELLYALLVQSANDAAEILAENYPGGRVAFVAAMNRRAQELHLVNTRFANPSGIDEEGHYSTAADLARLADVALRNEEFSRIVATENAVISSEELASTHVLNNVNELLGRVFGVRGVKTGYTEGAGQSLVTLVERNNHPVILVVLGSEDRFGDTQRLIEWVFEQTIWTDPLAGMPGQ